MTIRRRLVSTDMVSAPGMLRWAINGAKFKKDRAAMVRVIADTWSIPRDITEKLLLGEIAHTIEGDTVCFEAPK